MNVHNVPVHDTLYIRSANETIVNKYNVYQCVAIHYVFMHADCTVNILQY